MNKLYLPFQFKVGHTRRFHVNTSLACSEGETVYGKSWHVGSWGQVAGQGHFETYSTLIKGKERNEDKLFLRY